MFLYNQKYITNKVSHVDENSVDYYSKMNELQMVFIEESMDISVEMYRGLKEADGNMKIIQESIGDFFKSIGKSIKKFITKIIEFIRKWYNKIKDYFFGEDKSFTNKEVNSLLDDEETCKKLKGFKVETDITYYDYDGFFKDIDNGLSEILTDAKTFIDETEKDKASRVFKKYNAKGIGDLEDDWIGEEFEKVTVDDVKKQRERVTKLLPKAKKLEKEVSEMGDKLLKVIAEKEKNKTLNNGISIRVNEYTKAIKDLSQLILTTIANIRKEYKGMSKEFTTKAKEYLMKKEG